MLNPPAAMLSLTAVYLLGTFTALATAISPVQVIFPERCPSYEPPLDAVTTGVLTPEFHRQIELTREKYGIKGVSMAIVHADSEPEYASWGIRTEEGDPVTPDVST